MNKTFSNIAIFNMKKVNIHLSNLKSNIVRDSLTREENDWMVWSYFESYECVAVLVISLENFFFFFLIILVYASAASFIFDNTNNFHFHNVQHSDVNYLSTLVSWSDFDGKWIYEFTYFRLCIPSTWSVEVYQQIFLIKKTLLFHRKLVSL